MQVGTLHPKADDTLNTWELHPRTPKFTHIPRETIGCFNYKRYSRSWHLFSCNERLDGAQKECLHGHDKYKEMFKTNINIKASAYQHYPCPMCPREVMSKFLNVVVIINWTRGTCEQMMKELKVWNAYCKFYLLSSRPVRSR